MRKPDLKPIDELNQQDLNQLLSAKHEELKKKIAQRLIVCRAAIVANSLSAIKADDPKFDLKMQNIQSESSKLNSLCYTANEMNNNLKNYPNSLFNITTHQQLEAKKAALAAYDLILRVADNPNTPIDHELALLQIRHHKAPYFVTSVLIMLATLTTVILFPLWLPVLVPIASLTGSAIPLFALVSVLGAIASMIPAAAFAVCWVEDLDFCDSFVNSAPTYFGKVQPVQQEQKALARDDLRKKLDRLDSRPIFFGIGGPCH